MGKFYQSVVEDLILYAKQYAWFNSIPVTKTDKVSDTQERKSRAETIIDNGGTPLFPDVDAEYIVGYWKDCGVVTQGFNGPTPLSYQEIKSWSDGVGLPLNPFEFSSLRAMSEAYCAQYQNSKEPECAPPYGNPVELVDRTVVSKRVQNAFSSFIRDKDG